MGRIAFSVVLSEFGRVFPGSAQKADKLRFQEGGDFGTLPTAPERLVIQAVRTRGRSFREQWRPVARLHRQTPTGQSVIRARGTRSTKTIAGFVGAACLVAGLRKGVARLSSSPASRREDRPGRTRP